MYHQRELLAECAAYNKGNAIDFHSFGKSRQFSFDEVAKRHASAASGDHKFLRSCKRMQSADDRVICSRQVATALECIAHNRLNHREQILRTMLQFAYQH